MHQPTDPVVASNLPFDLTDAFDQLSVGVAIFDTSDRFCCLYHNAGFIAIASPSWRARGSIIGLPLAEMVAPESYQHIRSIFVQVSTAGVTFSSDDFAAVMSWDADVGPRSFEWTLAPLRQPTGTIYALIASGREITASKALEAEVRAAARRANEEHALLDALISTAPIGMAFLDRELRIVRINQRMAQINALPVSAYLGRSVAAIHPDLAATVEPLARAVLSTGRPIINVDLDLSPQANPCAAWGVSFYPVPDATGEIFGVGILVTDTSDDRRMQKELRTLTLAYRERAADLEALLDAVPAAVWIAHDPLCRVITGSAAASRLLRMAPESNLSKTASDPSPTTHFHVLHAGVELAPEDLPVQQAARGIEVRDFEEELVFDDGSRFTLLGNATPLRDEQGNLRGAVAAFLDITERKLAEQERVRLYAAEQLARSEAEAALKIRDTFFTMAAHELKTPLTALLGQVQLIERRMHQNGNSSERDQRALRALASQAVRLNKLVDAMLDLTRIERGYLSLERVPVDMLAIIRLVIAEIQPIYPKHYFHCCGPDMSLMILGDALRLEQVIYNLVENAVKYSPRGGEVLIRVVTQAAMLKVSVCDQGIGIPDADIPRLFERFYRARGASERHIAGMGIGLYVVREIVSLHGGEVSVQSSEGEGSCFTLTLPLLSA